MPPEAGPAPAEVADDSVDGVQLRGTVLITDAARVGQASLPEAGKPPMLPEVGSAPAEMSDDGVCSAQPHGAAVIVEQLDVGQAAETEGPLLKKRARQLCAGAWRWYHGWG
jgi:hypothetical protein